jgi:hypothetical protein
MDTDIVFFHELLTWALVCFGISFAITHSKVFSTLREKANQLHPTLGYFSGCPMCMGFWVGLLLSIVWISVTGNFLLDGFFGLSVSWILYCISWRLALHDPAV